MLIEIRPPSAQVRERAAERVRELATPAGALGRLGDLAVWWSAVRGEVAAAPPAAVRCTIFAGDHGVAAYGVSAYPREITGAMVRTFVAGRAGVCALAAQHGVAVRVLDVGVDPALSDLSDLPERVRAHHVRDGSGAIHLEDALTAAETASALAVGRAVADEEASAGADLLIAGDMGIGNTTPAAALVAAATGLPATAVTGRGTGIDDGSLRDKERLIQQALDRAGARAADPLECLAALGSADLAATTGYLVRAASTGTPVLLDGLISVACALIAERIAPGCAAWFAAGHRSTEPAQRLALDELGLVPLLDLDLRLGEGSGAVTAVPLVRSAATLLRDVALLRDLGVE